MGVIVSEVQVSDKQKEIVDIINDVKRQCVSFLEITDAKIIDERFIFEKDFIPEKDKEYELFESYLLASCESISRLFYDKMSHAKKGFWKKREFQSFSDFVIFSTNHIIESSVEKERSKISSKFKANNSFWGHIVKRDSISNYYRINRATLKYKKLLEKRRKKYLNSDDFLMKDADLKQILKRI